MTGCGRDCKHLIIGNGGDCQLYNDDDWTILAESFSYNKTISNMCAVYIKKE